MIWASTSRIFHFLDHACLGLPLPDAGKCGPEIVVLAPQRFEGLDALLDRIEPLVNPVDLLPQRIDQCLLRRHLCL